MADECDLEELTAFLEASDDEMDDKDVTKELNESSSDKTKVKENSLTADDDDDDDDGECNLEDIEAFLQASDDDHDDNVESETLATTENEEKEDTATVEEESKSAGEEMDLEDFGEDDFQELEEMMDSKNFEASMEKASVQSEPVVNTAQSGDENDELLKKKKKRKEESDGDDGTDRDDSGSESENLTHEIIEAEMAAMTKRMKELKSLLKKSKSSPESCKKISKTSQELEKKQSSSHDGKSKTSPQSQTTHSFEKKLSKSETDCEKSMTVDRQPSSDLLKREIQKHKSLLEMKGKKSKSDRHFSDIATDSSLNSRPSSKSKEREAFNVKQKWKEETDVDSNPFFAKSNKTCEQSDARPATSFYKKDKAADGAVDSKALFGDSDDSDWDDLAGEEKTKLSKEGKELKKLINSGHKNRQAHTPNYDPAVLKKPNMSRWTETNSKPLRIHPIQQVSQKPALDPVTGTVSGKYKVKDEYMQKSTIVKEDERESVTDPFCGIRIINPRVPMDVFKRKMEGRNLVKISRLVSKIGTSDLQKDNWVTIGVVVHKTEPRQSAAGKTYCIWKLSDLQNCDKTVTFFLFGNVYKEHWKNDLGVVIGLLNPSIMDKAEKNQAEIAITINHPQQLLMMGISKDLGRCRGTTKAGSPCSSFINKMQGEFCTYHVQSAYRKSSSKRTELQASTGVTPKAFTQQKNKNSGSGCFFYGGNTYTTQRPQAKSSKDRMTLNKLQSYEAKKAPGKITTMSLHDLEPEDEKKIDKLRQKDKDLLELLSVPSAGSMNFVKHLVKKDANPTVNKTDEGEILPSVSAKDLLQQHSKTLMQKKKEIELLSSKPTLGKGFGSGQDISLDAPIKKGKGCAAAEFAKQLAIAKIKSKGGLSKEDPNSVKKKIISPEAREKIRKRVAEDMEDKTTDDSSSKEPPQKKSKLLGDLDLNSPDVQQLLKKKSKHKGALAEAESEHEERYFSALEKKEQMEDKMGAIMEVPVKLFMCLQCKYRYFSVHERCKKENHAIKEMKGVKRFFKCKHCKKRTVSIDRLPTKPCKECGSSNWERVSMLKERSGPKLESEELCLRGNEQKFIGSLQGKASFNG